MIRDECDFPSIPDRAAHPRRETTIHLGIEAYHRLPRTGRECRPGGALFLQSMLSRDYVVPIAYPTEHSGCIKERILLWQVSYDVHNVPVEFHEELSMTPLPESRPMTAPGTSKR